MKKLLLLLAILCFIPSITFAKTKVILLPGCSSKIGYSTKTGLKCDGTKPIVDVCKNADGIQTVPPDGLRVDINGDCVPIKIPVYAPNLPAYNPPQSTYVSPKQDYTAYNNNIQYQISVLRLQYKQYQVNAMSNAWYSMYNSLSNDQLLGELTAPDLVGNYNAKKYLVDNIIQMRIINEKIDYLESLFK